MKRRLLQLFFIFILAISLFGCTTHHEVNYESTEQSTESIYEQASEQTSEQLSNKLSIDQNVSRKDFTGEWNRTNVQRACSAIIKIDNQKYNSFHFLFEGNYAANIGSLVGDAVIISPHEATCSVSNKYADNASAVIYFLFNDNSLSVTTNGDSMALGFGHNVKIDGVYTKSDPAYVNENIVNEIFPTDELKNRMSKLLGETAYTKMIDVMKNGLEYKNNYFTYSGFINGIGIGVNLKITDNKIYCLGYNFDSEGYTFYTNDSLYKDKLPNFIKCDNYRTDEPVHFVYKEI